MLLHKSNRLKNKVDKCHVTVSTKKLVGITIGGYTVDSKQSVWKTFMCRNRRKLKF